MSDNFSMNSTFPARISHFGRLAVGLMGLLILMSTQPLISQDSSDRSPDFNGNGVVDFPDLLLFAVAFGSKDGQENYESKYDLDESGEIDFSDFLIFVESFGQIVEREPSDAVLVEDHFVVTTRGEPDGVNVSVVDAKGFATGSHGQRITDVFLRNTDRARLVQIGGWGAYRLHGLTVYGTNANGYVRHALEQDDGVFWTATDQSPAYNTRTAGKWFVENDRPFTRGARAFATWMQNRNTLLISSLENPTADDKGAPVYCDDYDQDAESWIPLCGEIDDYVSHSGTGLANTVFVGAIDARPDFGGTARGAIRADGVFAPHAIYVESPNGSTSHATPVLAAYATNLAYANPTWSAARLKQELMKLARDEAIDYWSGATTSSRTNVTERRTIKVIRPAFAPGAN